MKRVLTLALLTALTAACGNKENNFDATGRFESTEVVVSAEAAGRIFSLDVDEGTTVQSGVTLGAIDSIQLSLQRLQLMKNITSVESSRPAVQTQIAALREQIAKQQTERRRIANLLKDNAATQKQLDDIESAIAVLERQLSAQLSTLEKSVESLNAQSSAIEIQVAQVDDRLAKCRISSPLTGVVLAKYAEVGELAAVGKPLFKVADTEHLYLRAYVTSGQLSDIKLGQKVRVTADFGGGKERNYTGTIAWIASESEFTPKSIQTKDDRENLVYATKIAVDNDGYIKIGMYGEVKF